MAQGWSGPQVGWAAALGPGLNTSEKQTKNNIVYILLSIHALELLLNVRRINGLIDVLLVFSVIN